MFSLGQSEDPLRWEYLKTIFTVYPKTYTKINSLNVDATIM